MNWHENGMLYFMCTGTPKNSGCKCMTWFWRIDQQLSIEVCPLLYIGGLSTKLFIGVCPLNYIGGLSTIKQISLFENSFSYMENCMCEGVGQDSGHGIG